MSNTNSKQRFLRTVLDYDGLAVGVSVGRSADREWILDFLAPTFSVSARKAADVEVCLTVDRERFAELERRGPAASGGVVAGLVLDDSTLRFERWTNAPKAREQNGEGSDAPAIQTAFDPQLGDV